MIQFIKTLKYETNPQGVDVFEYLHKVTLQKIDPPSTSPIELNIRADVVFYSPLRRVAETIQKQKGVEYIETSLLQEIPFDIKKLCTRKEWETQKSVIVRRTFKEAFIKDQLPVKRSVIMQEVKELLKMCLEKSKQGKVAVASHSFRLKIIETFIKTGGELEFDPKKIEDFISDNQKTYEFGGGFNVDKKEIQSINFRA